MATSVKLCTLPNASRMWAIALGSAARAGMPERPRTAAMQPACPIRRHDSPSIIGSLPPIPCWPAPRMAPSNAAVGLRKPVLGMGASHPASRSLHLSSSSGPLVLARHRPNATLKTAQLLGHYVAEGPQLAV